MCGRRARGGYASRRIRAVVVGAHAANVAHRHHIIVCSDGVATTVAVARRHLAVAVLVLLDHRERVAPRNHTHNYRTIYLQLHQRYTAIHFVTLNTNTTT